SWSLLVFFTQKATDAIGAWGVFTLVPFRSDLATPPASFTITGSGFANLGFGLSVANFTRNGTLLAQVRATSGNSTTLTVPLPTTQRLFSTLPPLTAAPVILQVYNQTGSTNSWSLVGSTSLTVTDPRPAPVVISPPPPPFALFPSTTLFRSTGSGFANLGFGLSVANFTRNGTLLAQVRATSGNSTTLTV